MRRLLALPLALAACSSSSSHEPLDAPADGIAIDAPPDAGPCGMRSGMRGLTHRTATVAGLHRTYLVYLPATLDSKAPLPLVFVHHGFTMSGQNMYDATEYAALADSEGIAVAFPDGQGGPSSLAAPWNVGTDLCPSTAGPPPDAPGDDFAFLDYMKADIAADQCIDTDHVYLTGFSMGGYFAHQAGCLRSDIRAVAPHSGGTHDLASCTTGHKPIIIFHGTADPVIPVGCADPGGNPPAGHMASAAAWAMHNGCGTTTTAHAVTNGTCLYYDNCPADGQVALCTFNAMGHCWAGGPVSAGVYACPGNAKATQLEWDFWKQYAH